MPGLLRGVARTAVVAGTASAVSGRVQRRQADKFAERDAHAAAQRSDAYAAGDGCAAGLRPADDAVRGRTAAGLRCSAGAAVRTRRRPRRPSQADVINQLKQLGELRDAGVLTEDEFAAQKAKLLG